MNASYTVCSFNSVTGGVDFEGAGNISFTADSDYSSINIFGTPVTFNAGTVDVVANGATTNISINYDGNSQGNNSLISTGGVVTLNADSPLSSAGTVNVTADAINITTKFSIHANALSSGNGGEIEITTNGGPISAPGGTIDTFLLAVNGMGEGMSAGGIRIDSAAAATIDGSKITATPGTDGDGGTIYLIATTALALTGTLTANGNGAGNGGLVFFESDTVAMPGATVNANSGSGSSGGTGGTVYLFSSGDAGLSNGNISVNALGSGNGGTINFNSSGALNLTGATIEANAAGAGDAGTMTLSYSSANTMNMGTLSANTATGETGGQITISQAGSEDLMITLDSIDTTVAGEIDGLLTLNVADQQSYAASLTVTESGPFNSILAVTAKTITVETNSVPLFTFGEITTTNGDLLVNATDSGMPALSFLAQPSETLTGEVEFTESATVNGSVNIYEPTITLSDSPTPTGISMAGSEPFHPIIFHTNQLTFGANRFLDGGANINGILIQPLDATSTLEVFVAPGSTTGIKNAFGAMIQASGSNPITINASPGAGRATFQMNSNAVDDIIPVGISTQSGNINVGPNVDITNTGFAGLKIQSATGAVNLQGSVTASNSVVISADYQTGGQNGVTLADKVLVTGTDGNETATINAGGNIVTKSVSSNFGVAIQSKTGSITLGDNVNTTGATGNETISAISQTDITQSAGTATTSGKLLLQSNIGNIGSAANPISVSAPNVTFNTGSSGGDVNVIQSGTAAVSLGNSSINGAPCSSGGLFNYSAGGALTLSSGNDVIAGKSLSLTAPSISAPASNITSNGGALILNATSQPISLGSNSLNQTISSTGGDIIIQLGAISTPYPNDATALNSAVTVIPGQGGVFWGLAATGCSANCGIAATGTCGASTPVHNISFDTKRILGGISLNGVSLVAN